MSRIDEALARASGTRPRSTAAAQPLPPDAEGVFASEPEAASGAAVAEAELPADLPADVAAAEPQTAIESPDAEDFRHLPQAEKLAGAVRDETSTEQYRRLAGRLHMAQAEHGTRIVMITSAIPGEGKTLTATNLALTLSESYKRQVLLVDADLRRPWVHELFQIPNVSGLNDGLRGEDDRKVPLLRLTDHLTVLTAGRPDRDPMSILSSPRMRRVLQEAARRFEWVLVDTPPVAMLTDAHLLSALVDAVLLVIESGRTPLAAINTAVEAVGRDRILGVVLNRADGALAYSTSYYRPYDDAPKTA
jgi:capsular exopolysaccharide synthesis family protein